MLETTTYAFYNRKSRAPRGFLFFENVILGKILGRVRRTIHHESRHIFL